MTSLIIVRDAHRHTPPTSTCKRNLHYRGVENIHLRNFYYPLRLVLVGLIPQIDSLSFCDLLISSAPASSMTRSQFPETTVIFLSCMTFIAYLISGVQMQVLYLKIDGIRSIIQYRYIICCIIPLRKMYVHSRFSSSLL